MSEIIEFKGKEYVCLNNIMYKYVKKYNNLRNNFKEIDNADEEMIKILIEAICPSIKIEQTKEDFLVDGQELKYDELEILLIKLRTAFNKIIETSLAYVFENNTKKNELKEKNANGAIVK
ncbi:MAG: hypothetical protein ACFFG0_04625 [Candidatus Thorarchaeota archaeon]